MIQTIFAMLFACVGSQSWLILPMVGLGFMACVWRLAYYLLGVTGGGEN